MKKRCSKCLIEKDIAEFHPHPEMKDGHRKECRACRSVDVRRYYKTPAGQDSIRRKFDSQEYRERQRAYQKNRRETAPERIRARDMVKAALRSGRLTRQPCEVCGGKAEAHHDDYSKPLAVRWLCTEHHGIQHRVEGDPANGTKVELIN